MRIDHHGLSLGVGDDSNADISSHLGEVLRKLRAEVRVLDVVDVLMGLSTIEGSHTCTLGAQMRMIIGSVEQIGDTRVFGDNAEKSTHNVCCVLIMINNIFI